MYLSYTTQKPTFIMILFTMWNAFWFICKNYYFFGLLYIMMCFYFCITECWKMYLCEFHYECVLIRARNCAIFGMFAITTVVIICLVRLTENRMTSDAQQENQHRHRPLKSG